MSTTNLEGPDLKSDRRSIRKASVIAALVAVAVLATGLLSAPKIREKFRSRQQHAFQQVVRADLDLIVAREAEFFGQHKTYTTDLFALSIFPKSVLYKFGFVRASEPRVMEGVADYNPDRKDIDALKKALPKDARIDLSPLTKLDQINFEALSSYCANCTATATGFRAVAAANLDDDAVLDIWTIDEKGDVQHLVDDLSQ